MRVNRLEPDSSGIVDWPTLSTTKKSVVTIGVFDGMHRGHRAVIQKVVELAHKQGNFAVVIMFDPSPKLVHSYAKTHNGVELPQDTPRKDSDELMAVPERLRLMKELGVDWVLSVHYTMAFSAKSFRYFIGTLVGKLDMNTLVLGRDATLGAGRLGNVESIEDLAEATGVFSLELVDDAGPGYTWIPQNITRQVPESTGEPSDPLANLNKAQMRAWTKEHSCKKVRVWSSSNVRYLLSQGRVRAAAEVLGRVPIVEGQVVQGEQRGRALGYPTANISPEHDGYMPTDGVYAGWLVDLGKIDTDKDSSGDDGSTTQMSESVSTSSHDARLIPGSAWRWPADISIGTKETFANDDKQYERVLEVNAITGGKWLDLYGHKVRVEFLSYLRPQEKFADADALVEQLKEDVANSLQLVTDEEQRL